MAEILHEPDYRSAATRLRAEMLEQPSAAQVVSELEAIADGRRP
jgi:hypothetical protein